MTNENKIEKKKRKKEKKRKWGSMSYIKCSASVFSELED